MIKATRYDADLNRSAATRGQRGTAATQRHGGAPYANVRQG